MKHMFIFFALSMLTLNAFAAPIPPNKLAAYKEAVIIAIKQQKLTCKWSVPGEPDIISSFLSDNLLLDILEQTQSASVNDYGSQPVLVFTYGGTPEYVYKQIIYVTTTADYKSIIEFQFYETKANTHNVNLGTIENPNIVSQTDWLNSGSALCK